MWSNEQANSPTIVHLTDFQQFDLAFDVIPETASLSGSGWSRLLRFQPNDASFLHLRVMRSEKYESKLRSLGVEDAISSAARGNAGLSTFFIKLGVRASELLGQLSQRELRDVKKPQHFRTDVFAASVIEFNAVMSEGILANKTSLWKFIICHLEQVERLESEPHLIVEVVAAGPHDEMMKWRGTVAEILGSVRAFEKGGYVPDLIFTPKSERKAPAPAPVAEAIDLHQPELPPPLPVLAVEPIEALPPARTKTILEWANGKRVTLAIVFTDIVDSTRFGQLLGDETMRAVRQEHFNQSRRLVIKHAGYEVKTIGDSFMVLFRSVDSALDYAVDLRNNTGHSDLEVRAGIHIGAVDVSAHDVDGTAVSYAARVVSKIAGPEIWVSDPVKRDLDNIRAMRHERFAWLRHEGIELKSFEKSGPQTLWSLESIY